MFGEMTFSDMTGPQFFELAIYIAFALSILAFLLTIFRLALGPSLPDRILALDLLVILGIGFIVIFTLATGYYAYLDMAIALGLVGFLATIAFARFVMHQAEQESRSGDRKVETIDED